MSREETTVTDTTASGPLREWLVVFLKGVAMGTADTLPGVSGGTIALITGIYERLITALSSLDPAVLAQVGKARTPTGRRELVGSLLEMDVHFLVVLAAGVASAIVTVSRVVHVALVDVPGPTFAFFFGLIAASAVVLYGEVHVDSARQVVAGLVGFGLAFVMSDPAVSGSLPHSPLVVLVVGMVVISATILPGVSGSFLLLLFGQYEFLTGTLKRFVDVAVGTATGGDPARLLGPGIVVASFCVGALVGLLSMARVIRWALDTYRTATLTFLVSLMVGALRTPVERIAAETGTLTTTTVGALLVAALAGAAAVLLLEHYTAGISY